MTKPESEQATQSLSERAAREWAEKKFPVKEFANFYNWNMVCTEHAEAHLAGQAHGEKRERERIIAWWQEKTKQEFWTARDLLAEFLKEIKKHEDV